MARRRPTRCDFALSPCRIANILLWRLELRQCDTIYPFYRTESQSVGMCKVWWSREKSETRGESWETRCTVGVHSQGYPVNRHEPLGDREPLQKRASCLHTALFGGHISASHDWTLMTVCVSHDLRQLSLPLLGTSSRTLVSGDLKGSGKMGVVQYTGQRILRTLYRRGSSETKVYA